MESNSESSIPLSIRSETKDKFDALLKARVHKQERRKHLSRSKEKLLNEDLESTTGSSENLLEKNTDNLRYNDINEENKSYILNKFLGRSNDIQMHDEIISVEVENPDVSRKPPIPKPRKKKQDVSVQQIQSPTNSQGTFEVTSPKILQNKSDSGSSNDKTYNVLGDVVIHDEGHLRPKITVKTQNIKSKEDTETFGDNNDLDTKDEKDKKRFSDFVQNKDEHKIQESIELEEINKDSIEYTNEVTQSKSEENKHEEISEDLGKKTKSTKNYKYEKIIEIVIHKTDCLQLNSLVVHPVVKVHVVDIATGKYFPKSDRNRSVVFFYENKNCDYITPVMTHTYNLQENRILFPSWEETILFNEDYEYFKEESRRIMLFFEILDFVPFSLLHSNQKGCTKGWHNIAFAFLKLSGKNKCLNMGNKLRLQLYHSYQTKKDDPHLCTAWTWWKKKKLEKYPSTLYISIKSVLSPTKLVETLRSKTPVQSETSSKTKLFEDLKKEVPEIHSILAEQNDNGDHNGDDGKNLTPTWSRLPHEICKIPNKCMGKLESYDEGCFIMKFSCNGLYLACAVKFNDLFCVTVYSVESLTEIYKFSSHQGFIYDIKWSRDDTLLISASADNTISIFDMTFCSFLQILPHPSFVYSCDISHDKDIASGCYDGTIRIWNQKQNNRKIEFHLFQELEGHRGYITSLCFNKKSNFLLSADSTGAVMEWQKEKDDWSLAREIMLLDLRETIINQIKLFPKEKKLLVHSRDSTIRIVDLKSGCVLQWLRGAFNKRVQSCCTISPCGTYVYCGSENGTVHVWNSKNGREIASYTPFDLDNKFLVIHCVDFHPFDNIIAISHYGENLPILLYSYDNNIENPEIQLTVMNDDEEYNSINKNEKITKFKSIGKNLNKGNVEKLDFKGILQKMDTVIASENLS